MSNENEVVDNVQLMTAPQHVLFAETAKDITIGVVSNAVPSSLALLAAGVAGVVARRILHERAKQASELVLVASKRME